MSRNLSPSLQVTNGSFPRSLYVSAVPQENTLRERSDGLRRNCLILDCARSYDLLILNCVDNHFIGWLLRINGQLTEAADWSIRHGELDHAAKLLPIAEAVARLLADIIDKDVEDTIRRTKISLAKKPSDRW